METRVIENLLSSAVVGECLARVAYSEPLIWTMALSVRMSVRQRGANWHQLERMWYLYLQSHPSLEHSYLPIYRLIEQCHDEEEQQVAC